MFDKREACDVSNPEGVGGVVKHIKGNASKNNKVKVLSKCVACEAPWDR